MLLAKPFATLALLGLALHAAAAEPDWREQARIDLDFAAQAIAERHAGAVLGHAHILNQLERGLRQARADLPLVRSAADHRALLRRFVAGFGDPHLGLQTVGKLKGWNGLLIDAVDGRFEVVHAEPDADLPPVGSELLDCDGVWIGSYLKARVAPGVTEGLEMPSGLSQLARRVMFDNDLGWAPGSCRFRLADGPLREWALPARPFSASWPEERLDRALAQTSFTPLPVGLTQPAPGVLWAAISSLNLGDPPTAQALDTLISQLAQQGPKAQWVVFDLRGNGGGASSPGGRALKALYGESYGGQLAELPYNGKQAVAHPDTLQMLRGLAARPDLPADMLGQVREALQALEGAQQRGERVATLSPVAPPAARDALRAQVRQRPGGPRLAALIDRGCFSSCMALLQMLQGPADTLVLGEATLGYSPYGEIAPLPLPSGQGTLRLPSAFFVSEQAAQQPFVPQHRYPGRMHDGAAVQAWALQQLQAAQTAR